MKIIFSVLSRPKGIIEIEVSGSRVLGITLVEMGKLRNDEVHEQITLVIKILAAWMKAAVFCVSLQGHHNFVIKNPNLGMFYKKKV
jgi:hypothetical protein